MPDRDELIERYADDLREKCGLEPDMALLEKITLDCEPEIHDPEGARVAKADGDELRRVERDFLIGRLGLPDDAHLMGGIQKAIRVYGRSDPYKYRAVVHYLLVKHFGKEDVFV